MSGCCAGSSPRVLTRPTLPRLMLLFAPLGRLVPGRWGAMAQKAPRPQGPDAAGAAGAAGAQTHGAAARLCAESAWRRKSTRRCRALLARRDIELVELPGAGCCGALSHHLGREEEARGFARRLITAYEAGSYDGVFISATGWAAHMSRSLTHLFPGRRRLAAPAPPNSPPPLSICSNCCSHRKGYRPHRLARRPIIRPALAAERAPSSMAGAKRCWARRVSCSSAVPGSPISAAAR